MPRLQITMDDDLYKQVKARGDSDSETGREILERYFALLLRARVALADRFSGGEQALLADVLNGTPFESYLLGSDIRAGDRRLTLLEAELEDAEPSYFEKWGVDRTAFLAKLNALTPLEEGAVIDSIERFWRAASTGIEVDPRRILSK